jgi:hypothetical protein
MRISLLQVDLAHGGGFSRIVGPYDAYRRTLAFFAREMDGDRGAFAGEVRPALAPSRNS